MDNISSTAAVSSILSSVTVVAAVYYAAGQVRESRKMRALDTVLTLHGDFMSPAFNELRRDIRSEALSPPDPAALWESPDGLVMGNMINQMELLGVLVKKGLLDFDLVTAVFPFFPRTWKSVKPFVEHRRSLGQRFNEYATNAEYLASRYSGVLDD